MIEACFTERLTSQSVTQVGHSDPVVRYGTAIAQGIKVTLGITGLSFARVHIVQTVWHLDVDSSHPPGVVAWKGSAVRWLKRYASWVQYDVSQYGPYLLKEKVIN